MVISAPFGKQSDAGRPVLPFRGKEAKAYLHGGEGLLKDIGLRDRPIAAFERECTSVMYREDDGFLNGKGCV